MNHSNTENARELRAELQQQQQVDAMVSSVQSASEARDRSEANYRVARAFDRSADRLSAIPNLPADMHAVSEARHAEYTAHGDKFALEATKHDMEVDQAALRLGEHVVRHEAVPEYSPKEALSVIDLR